MKRVVRLSFRAERDLASILVHVAKDSPQAALRMVDRLDAAVRDLERSALSFPLLHHHEAEGIRRRVVGPYNILYVIDGHSIDVLHILHGARDLDTALSELD